MLDAWASEAGRFDILVNNAGLLSAETAGDTFDAADFARTLSVNLASAGALSASAIRHFLAKPPGPERGVIINTTSVHEKIPKPGYLGYAASKAGLGMLTRTLALEFAERGVRVNAVGPGAIETPMNDSWRSDPGKRRAVADHIPMGHTAQADDIAAVYAFLASAEARYITGQTIYACGGLTLFADFKHNWAS
jgi:glucose 1-dehydrogenase